MIYNPWELKKEIDNPDRIKNSVLGIFTAFGIYTAAIGLANIAGELEKRYTNYGIPEYNIYNINDAAKRMEKAIDMQDAGKCLDLKECYKMAGEEH